MSTQRLLANWAYGALMVGSMGLAGLALHHGFEKVALAGLGCAIVSASAVAGRAGFGLGESVRDFLRGLLIGGSDKD